MRLTRSTDLLSMLDGLCFLDSEIIDVAASFYSELKYLAVNNGDDVIDKLTPHVTNIMVLLEGRCGDD